MLTNDQNAINLKDNLIANNYEVGLIKITLSNEKEESIVGKGLLCQNAKGNIILKFFPNIILYQSERIDNLINRYNNSNFEGYFLSNSDYWKMEGFDSNNLKYNCDKIHSFSSKDNFSLFELNDILYTDHKLEETRIVCFGKYIIPHSDYIQQLTKGEGLCYSDVGELFMVELNDMTLRIVDYVNYLDIKISNTDKISFDRIKSIICTINFCFGIDLEPIFVNLKDDCCIFYPSFNKNKQISKLSSPISNGGSYSDPFFINHKELFKRYFEFIEKDAENTLQIIHKRIWYASQSYPYIYAVTLTSQIESICKVYYSDLYVYKKECADLINEAINIINGSNLQKKGKGEIVAILSRNKPKENPSKSDISVYQLLKSLFKRKVISEKKLYEVWLSLRNITTHGDTYGDKNGYNSTIKLIKNNDICMNLYYQLIFNLIHYNGIYSWKEWDNNSLKVYFPYKLEDLGIKNGDYLTYNNDSYLVNSSNGDRIKLKEEIELSEKLNKIVNTHTNYNPLSDFLYEGNSLIDLIKDRKIKR